MSAKRACLACRARKVKCVVGLGHRCERCTTLGLEGCLYKPFQKRGVGNTLRMGQACVRCRARKKKCDAKRPCTTCITANRATECKYEIHGALPSHLDHSQFISWNGPGPSGSGNSQRRWAAEGMVSEPSANLSPVVAEAEVVPTAGALITSLAHNDLLSHTSPRTRVLLPPFSAISSLIVPSIPPDLHVPLSFLGAGGFQLSEVALEDLNMKFRLRILCRLNNLGVRLSLEKQQALLRGDTSGAVIHPFFVYGAQALGMYFCEGMDSSPAMTRLRTQHTHMSSMSLANIFEIRDWELLAQATVWIISGSIVLQLSGTIHLYVRKYCEAINAAKLQFIPTYGQPPAISETLREKFSALSQFIYFENFLFLTCGGPAPTMSTRIEKEFRRHLQQVYPALFKICPLTMRTQTILLVRESMLILNLRPTDEARLGSWRQSCDQVVTLLDDYSQTMLSNMRRFQELRDSSGAGMIGASCVNCLAHLAVLCETLNKVGPVPQMDLYALCDSTLERLGELARDIRMEEYTHLDLLLGVSWKKALEVFEARLANVPLGHGRRLRHWKEIVAKVRSDFVAKLPDAELPTLAAWAKYEEDRTGGSRC